MILSKQVRLLPTKEQEIMFFKHINASRFIYNWGLETWNKFYEETRKCSSMTLSKELTKLKKLDGYKWLNDVSGKTLVITLRDLDNAFQRFFKKVSNYPKFKSKKIRKYSFPVRCEGKTLYFDNNFVKIEKIVKVKYKSKFKVPNTKYYNARIYYDGKYWILSFGIDVDEKQVEVNKDLSIGIDLGVKDLAILSNGIIYKNINKSKKMKKLDKKLKKLHKQISRKYEMNKIDNKYIKTNNIIKLEKKLKLIYRKMTNIRNNYIHYLTSDIIKLKPYRVVIEDLNVMGLLKNKHLSKSISEQKFYEVRRQLEYKCKWNNIELIIADRFYPSSKLCSCCGNKKINLKLKDRVYKCHNCSLSIDRDYNASINLSKYKVS